MHTSILKIDRSCLFLSMDLEAVVIGLQACAVLVAVILIVRFNRPLTDAAMFFSKNDNELNREAVEQFIKLFKLSSQLSPSRNDVTKHVYFRRVEDETRYGVSVIMDESIAAHLVRLTANDEILSSKLRGMDGDPSTHELVALVPLTSGRPMEYSAQRLREVRLSEVISNFNVLIPISFIIQERPKMVKRNNATFGI